MRSNSMFVRRIFLALFIIIISLNLPAQVQTARYISTNPKSNAYYEYLPQGYDPNGTAKYPLIVFIHGMGELGAGTSSTIQAVLNNGTPRQIYQGVFPTSFTVNGVVTKPIVISPQFTEWPWASDINTLLDYLVTNYKVDIKRIYLTGLSMGGGVIWDYVNFSAAYANRIAAIVPICGASWPNQNGANIIAAANIAIWATHNDGDPTVTVNNTINFVNYVNAAPIAPTPLAKKTIFSSTSHDAWSRTYDLNFKENNLNVYEWMLGFSKNAVTNLAPIVNAGANQSLPYLTSSATLTGTVSDADGTISSFVWTKVSGPTGGNISSPNSLSTIITGLNSGTYIYRLTATDNGNSSGYSDVTITVNSNNQGPWVNAGSNQTITLPVNSVTLSGSATDPDGTVSSYLWSKQTGPAGGTITSPSSPVTNVTGLNQGVYIFQLSATDNSGTTTSVNVTVTVLAAAANILPVVNAGLNQNITLPVNSATLSGSATDADGWINTYTWSFVSGNSGSTINSPFAASTTITGLTAGTYTFKLTVTDNAGGTASSNVTITVTAAANILPVVNAGVNQNITLPVSTATLNGSATDADGWINTYTWSFVSGNSGSTINSPFAASTTITGLTAGTYTFKLTVTDNAGGSASSNVTVTVTSAANILPVVNAGVNQNITLPVSTATLNGSATDADGWISAYTWSFVSGNSGSTINSPSAASTTITGLTAGSYTFKLTVTDNAGGTASSNVTITVTAAANILPVVNAGADQNIYLPVNTGTLSGTASDPDGSVIGTAWTKLSGPAGGIITSVTTNVTTITSLQAGVYVYRFTGKDNSLASVSDTITVTVITAPVLNAIPVANAGGDQTITLPVNTATLSGVGIDTDGYIIDNIWTKVSGPAGGNISSASATYTSITSLQAGIYMYTFTVTDNYGTTDTDSVIINVLAAPVNTQTGNTIRVNLYGGRNASTTALWNNNWNVNVSSGYFVNESNAITNVQARFSSSVSVQDNGATYGTGATICPADVLRYNATATSNRSISIYGLNPAKTYSIEFFGSSNILGNKTVFQIGKTKITLNTDNNISTSALFAGVVPTSTGSVKVSVLRTGTYINVAGFIIKEETSLSGRIMSDAPEEEIVSPINDKVILNIFPNPVQSVLQVKLNAAINDHLQYYLVNVEGKLLYQSQKRAQGSSVNTAIDMSSLKPGMYILSVIIEGKLHIRKVIKN